MLRGVRRLQARSELDCLPYSAMRRAPWLAGKLIHTAGAGALHGNDSHTLVPRATEGGASDQKGPAAWVRGVTEKQQASRAYRPPPRTLLLSQKPRTSCSPPRRCMMRAARATPTLARPHHRASCGDAFTNQCP
eukprot:3484935-Prymnesium_polylepis.3